LGEQRAESVKITVIDYSESDVEEKELQSIGETSQYQQSENRVSWINIDGLHDVELFEKIGKQFGIHSLTLEDCLNTRQRPKMDEHGDYLFVVMKMLYVKSDADQIEKEQVSLILGANYIISFQEREGDVFSIIRERIRNGKGRIRKAKSDYLAYAIIDAVVDNYFVVLDGFNEKIDALDLKVIDEPSPEVLQEIYFLKREIVTIRKSVVPLRDVLSRLAKGDPELIDPSTEVYLGDVFDHLLQVIESIDANREILSGLIDLYLSSVSNRTNEIMKVLTIMAAIFIPITFVAGVYGMNFEVIPELKWKYGYAFVWAVIFSITGGMLIYFKRRKWI
jgi:magnesium transporter